MPWCSHQLKVNFPTFFPSLLSPALGGSFFQASSFLGGSQLEKPIHLIGDVMDFVGTQDLWKQE
jgi:hypothetical protein